MEVSQEMINVMQKIQSRVVIEHKVPNSNAKVNHFWSLRYTMQRYNYKITKTTPSFKFYFLEVCGII